MKSPTMSPRARLSVEALEDRLALSLYHTEMRGTTLVAFGNDSASNIQITRTGATTKIADYSNWFIRSYTGVAKVQFVGGAGADRIVQHVPDMHLEAWGNGGNDILDAFGADDYLDGGDGNDTILGWGGNDILRGGGDNDVLRDMNGDDQLVGGIGDDRLNGGAGADKMWGGEGRDVLIAIDGGTSDYLQGDAGRDVMWADQNGSSKDRVYGAATEDGVKYVPWFVNGADRTLDGDSIADPTPLAGRTKKAFIFNPLFSRQGPQPDDVRQGALGDCWLMAGLGVVALDNPFAIQSSVVDFDDGSYGVALGGRFYRVDFELAVTSANSTTPAYARLGAENSMWVAIVEKAYAHYRTGANTYASLASGWSVDVNRAFGSTSAGEKDFKKYKNAADLAKDIVKRFSERQAVTVGFLTVQDGCPCITFHQYTVAGFTRNAAGVVTSIRLRNPWGFDGAGNDGNNDGYVTVTPAQIFGSTGRVNWGRV